MSSKFKGELYEVNGYELAEFQAVALSIGWSLSVIPISKDAYKITFFESEAENANTNKAKAAGHL